MARQVLPIVGAVIGGIYGGPSGAQAGYAIGSLVGNAVDPLVIKGPRIGDSSVQTSAEGVYRPVVFGTAAVMGNVIERGNRKIKKVRSGGGKGGPVNEEERVYWTFAIRICEGPIAGILRIWEDEKLVYDIRPESTIQDESAEFFLRCRMYNGDEDQLPDPSIEEYRGIGNTPAYRGTAYIVFPNADLTDRRESIPNYRFEVSQISAPVLPGTIMQLGVSGSAVGSVKTVSSADGITWAAANLAPGTPSIGRLVAVADNRFVGVGSLAAWYTDDYGATWTAATESFAGTATSSISYADGVIVVAALTSGYYRSTDNGESYVRHITPWFNEVKSTPSGLIVAAGQYSGNFYWSPDFGLSWNVGATHGLSFASGGSSWRHPYATYFGGRSGGHPAVSITSDGQAKQVLIIDPASTRVPISGAAFMTTDGVTQMVVGSDGGGVAWYWDDDDQKFYEITPGFGSSHRISSVVHNGVRFIIGTDEAPSGNGKTYTSEDGGRTWTQRTNDLTYEIYSMAAQPPISPEGQGKPVSLASIVSAIHERAESYDYDVTALADQMVDGVVLAGDYTCADAIKTLAPVYFFDCPEYDDGSGYRIYYRRRGAEALQTITIDDMVSVPDETVRQDALERPRKLHMAFQSPTVGYAAAKASPSRNSPDVQVVGEVSTEVPVAFSDVNEAWQRADIMLKQVWVEIGGEEEFSLSFANLGLVPSDVVGIYLRDQARRMRITQVSIEPGVLRVKALPDRQSAYTSNITGIPLPPPTPPPPSVVGQTIAPILDIPALNDLNDYLGYYVGLSGQTEAWYGGVLQRSTDAGMNWQEAARTRLNTIMGTLAAPFAAACAFFPDRTNRVGVSLFMDDEISSLTERQFLSEGGSFAVEWADSNGLHWEVLQYRDAEQDSDGIWWLSHLARGRLNTQPAEHLTGARVVFLDSVLIVEAVTGWIDTTLEHRAVSFGNSPEGAPITLDPYTAQSQREWPVADLLLSRDGDTISARAIPRHRFGTEDRPVRSVHWIGYRWLATDGTNTIALDNVSDETSFDTTGWSTPITVSVAQINRFTGAGPTISEQIA